MVRFNWKQFAFVINKINRMEPVKSTFITAEGTQTVLQAYRDLNKTIDEMDKKVEHVIKKHEAEFLYAYRNHISKIKKELAEIKHKSQEQEKMFSSNDRIQYLQKQMVIFRDQALKLYNKLDEKTQENEYLKTKVKELEKQQQIVDIQEKQKIRILKVQEMNKATLEMKVHQLQEVIVEKDQQIAKLNKKIQDFLQQAQRKTFTEGKIASLSTSRRGSSLRQKISKRVEAYDSEMKQWFLDCIRTVKREVAMRNSNSPSFDISQITSIDEFKTVDKLRLLQLFLQNEKLLTWLYERIFPDRLSQFRYKISSQYESQDLKQKDIEEVNISQMERILLPKVARNAKSQLRTSGVVKNGRLNVSQFS